MVLLSVLHGTVRVIPLSRIRQLRTNTQNSALKTVWIDLLCSKYVVTLYVVLNEIRAIMSSLLSAHYLSVAINDAESTFQ
jgi:hypothetical protein